MTTPAYITLEELWTRPAAAWPQEIDALQFTYHGVRCHVYGLLHGLTGGTNKAYVDLVNRTISQAPGMRLGEMRFMKLYRGLDGEMDDWLQMPLRDAFRSTFAAYATPARIFRLFKSVWQERRRRHDRFGRNPLGVRRLQDLGGSPAFHAIEPTIRRHLTGMPDPATYLQVNLARRRGQPTLGAPRFPDPDYHWLATIEPWINIPLRSIHMLETGVLLAQRHGKQDVSMFVGYTHCGDMAWYAAHEAQTQADPLVQDTVKRAIRAVVDPKAEGLWWKQFCFSGASALGGVVPLLSYLVMTAILVGWLAHGLL